MFVPKTNLDKKYTIQGSNKFVTYGSLETFFDFSGDTRCLDDDKGLYTFEMVSPNSVI